MSQLVHVDVHHDADHAIVAVRGRVFIDTIDPLRAALTPLLTTDPPRIVLDLSAVEICDSSGLNLIAGSHHTATRHGGWLRVVGLQPMVRRVVDATNLDRLLSIHTTVDDAIHGRLADTADTRPQRQRSGHPTQD
jgi:anti-sigma B factor antagonist